MSKDNLLDDIKYIRKLDSGGMLGILSDFPGQLRRALRNSEYRGGGLSRLRYANIVFTGLGGSAIIGAIVRACVLDEISVPFLVNRDYFLPGFANSKTLSFICSYSGNTEETVNAYKDAKRKGVSIVVITSGGALELMARKDSCPLIKVPGGLPPRCAIGYSLVPVIVLLSRLGLIKDKTADIEEAVGLVMHLRDKLIGPEVVLRRNKAKRIAHQMAGRPCAIYGWSKNMDCVVTRWRTQINENSKMLTTTGLLPEINHNEIVGFRYPKEVLKDMTVIFLRDKGDYIRIQERIKITASLIKKRVHKVIEVSSEGKGTLSRLCSLIYIGDFVSFYLAVLNGEDPTPVKEIDYLKKELARSSKRKAKNVKFPPSSSRTSADPPQLYKAEAEKLKT